MVGTRARDPRPGRWDPAADRIPAGKRALLSPHAAVTNRSAQADADSGALTSASGYQVQFHEIGTPAWYTWLLCCYALIVGPYLVWRTIVINWHVWFGPAIYAAEVYSIFMTASSLWIVHRIEVPVHRPANLASRQTDAFIPTYNEPLTVLEPTVRGATEVRGIGRVLVLDDGNRAEVAQMAQRLGVDYFARETNTHAKAGNLNNGLAQSTAEFILCLDADHVPTAKILERLLGYCDDPRVAFVQSPQCFSNTRSFVFRRTSSGRWFEQGTFYNVLQPAKNRFNSAFFVGTSAVIRRSALDSIGGFATGTATEDIHTSLRLHAKGWKSVFVPEPLAFGLEAENLKEYFRQRRRWAAGSLGLLIRSPDSPLRVRGLSWQQRLNYVNATLAHVLGLQKLASFLLPIACVLAVASPVSISWVVASYVLLGFAIFSIILTYLFGRGTYHPILTEAYLTSNFIAHLSGLWGVIKVQKKFRVSRKLAPRAERTWLKAVLWGMLGVALAGCVRALDLLEHPSGPHAGGAGGLAIICLGLIGYNVITFLWFFAYLWVYERRHAGSPPAGAGVAVAEPWPALARINCLAAAREWSDSGNGTSPGGTLRRRTDG
jgi:cellulose synthase/poly-beta-1,6-N-acetylglucosamine synthase-like glycosyltransferase